MDAVMRGPGNELRATAPNPTICAYGSGIKTEKCSSELAV
jgi:hypothetical protein